MRALALVLLAPAVASQAVAGEASGGTQVAANSAAKPSPDAAPPLKAARPDSPTYTRFVVGLDRKSEYQVFSLSNPNRVVVELSDVSLKLPDLRAGASGLVKSFRGGLAAQGKTRIVIDVTQPVIVESAKIDKAASGFRLSLDIVSVDAALRQGRKALRSTPSGLGAAGVQPPLPKRAASPRERAARTYKPVIVLDPGHGGDDTGATRHGAVEKNVVLAFSHVLREQLEKTGRYRVLMTRDKDIFIPLDERVAFAERNSANIFMAIHADYAQSRARGATIFSLRDNVAKSLKRSTLNRAPEKVLSKNELSAVKGLDADTNGVTNILADLAERDVERTKDRTDLFAKTVIGHMSESTTMRGEPDQQAAFRVLKTAQFPSVLIELAYVTNKQDAENLQSDAWREKVAESIVQAIDNYFSNEVAYLPM
jgi:N-acetylmuramoyl-L-alanine amidase